MGLRVPPFDARTARRLGLAALAALLLGALGPALAAAEAASPFHRARDGDAAAVVAGLAEGYRAGTLDVWTARLYQDLQLEAGQREALLAETKAAFPDAKVPLGAYLLARLAEPKDLDTALQRVMTSAPDPGAVLLDQARAALAADRVPQAAALRVKLRKACGEREETAILEARIAEAAGDRRSGERLLAAWIAAHPGDVEARRAWADLLLAMNRRADAIAVLEEGLALARSAPLLVGRAAAAIDLHDLDAAKRLLEEVKVLGRPSLQAEAHALRAAHRIALRDLPGAEAAADAGLKVSPSSVHALRAKARSLELAGKTSDALRRLDAAIRLEPTWARLYSDQGAVYSRARRFKEAGKALAEARKRDPDLMEAALWLAVIEEEQGNFAAAEKAYRAVLKVDSDHLGAHRMLAGVLYMTSKYQAADEEAGWVIERDPKDPAAWFVRGRVALRQGRFEDALAAFDRAVEGDPTYALAHAGRGWVHEEKERWEEARKAYEAAVLADPDLALPHRYLGELLDEQLDEPVLALDQLKKYLELGGSDPDEDVWHRIQRLSK